MFFHGLRFRVSAEALETFPTNTWQQKSMIDANAFDASTCCQLLAVGLWSKKNGHHLALDRSKLNNCNLCSGSGGKVKKFMLVKDDSFIASLQAHGGRASEKMGYGGDAATRDVFYRANKAIRGAEEELWEPK